MAATTPIHLERPDGKGLAAGTLGLWGSTVIGLASTAPVYSLVATLGFVVLAVGAQAPIAFIIAFVPMLLIAFAYRELNNAVPDCGTTLHLGHQGVRSVGGLDGRLGCRRRRYGRARQPRPDRLGLLLVTDRTGPREQRLARGRRGRALHRCDDLGQLAWSRDRRAHPEHSAGHPVPGARRSSWWPRRAVLRRHRPEPHALLLGVDEPLRLHGLVGLHRGHPPRTLHLLGLGHLPRPERGDQGPEAHSRPRRAADHRHPAGHVCRRHHRGHDVRRAGGERHRPRQRGERRRLLLAIKDGPAGPVRLGARRLGDHLGDLVDADHHPADRPRHARDGRVPRPAGEVQGRAPPPTRRRRSRRSSWAWSPRRTTSA